MTALALALAAFACGWAASRLSARRRLRERARFLAFALHEVNTPVSSLRMTSANFVQGVFGEIPESQRPWHALLHEQTLRLGALVGDLRDFIHLELLGDFFNEPETLSWSACARSALEGVRDGFARARAPLLAEGLEVLPEIEADPERVQRVIGALLQHARKFRKDGPVHVRGEGGEGGFALCVDYEGHDGDLGCAPGALELYYPVAGKSKILGGVGLGLGLARKLWEAQGGRLTLERAGGRCRLGMRWGKGSP